MFFLIAAQYGYKKPKQSVQTIFSGENNMSRGRLKLKVSSKHINDIPSGFRHHYVKNFGIEGPSMFQY